MTRRYSIASGLVIESGSVLFMSHLKLGVWVYSITALEKYGKVS